MTDLRRKNVLVTNDDGVSAPGLQALVKELNRQCECNIYICGPFGERSGQSNAISLGKRIHTFEISVPGAVQAFAVDGTPADSVVVALRSPLLKTKDFDIVVSGINRGDNAGVHVVYSGTVGAAREASCAGYHALAFSIDNHSARSEEQYAIAARYACCIIREHLGMGVVERDLLKKVVLNVNIPGHDAVKGIHLCRQSRHSTTSDLAEFDGDEDFVENNSHKDRSIHMGDVTLRAFKYHNLRFLVDRSTDADHHLLTQGWCTVTPLDSLMDLPLSLEDATMKYNPDLISVIQELVRKSAAGISVDCEAVVR